MVSAEAFKPKAKKILGQVAVNFRRVKINELTVETSDFIDQNPCVVDYLAYFLKEPLVWTAHFEEADKLNYSEYEVAIRSLAQFLDTAPWLSGKGSPTEVWNSLEFLVLTKLIRYEVDKRVFAQSSRLVESIPVPVFYLQYQQSELPEDIWNLVREFALSPDVLHRERAGLIEDLGAAAPQLGGKNTADAFGEIDRNGRTTIRQALYSGRTITTFTDVNGVKREIDYVQLVRDHKEVVVKLLILSPSAVVPLDEGTLRENKPGPQLRRNLIDGMIKMRELNLKSSEMKRLQIRYYGDNADQGLFRGVIIEEGDQIKVAQFCVWDYQNQRGTHGEYAQTNGSTNLAILQKQYFDQVFEKSVPIFKRQLLGWMLWTKSLVLLINFALLIAGILICVYAFNTSNETVWIDKMNWDVALFLIGPISVILVLGKEILQRVRTVKFWDTNEWIKFFGAKALKRWKERQINPVEKLSKNKDILRGTFVLVDRTGAPISVSEIENQIQEENRKYTN